MEYINDSQIIEYIKDGQIVEYIKDGQIVEYIKDGQIVEYIMDGQIVEYIKDDQIIEYNCAEVAEHKLNAEKNVLKAKNKKNIETRSNGTLESRMEFEAHGVLSHLNTLVSREILGGTLQDVHETSRLCPYTPKLHNSKTNELRSVPTHVTHSSPRIFCVKSEVAEDLSMKDKDEIVSSSCGHDSVDIHARRSESHDRHARRSESHDRHARRSESHDRHARRSESATTKVGFKQFKDECISCPDRRLCTDGNRERGVCGEGDRERRVSSEGDSEGRVCREGDRERIVFGEGDRDECIASSSPPTGLTADKSPSIHNNLIKFEQRCPKLMDSATSPSPPPCLEEGGDDVGGASVHDLSKNTPVDLVLPKVPDLEPAHTESGLSRQNSPTETEDLKELPGNAQEMN
ncbi:hypothetical protein Btru_051918 [Bulinus truncatus]|nr:hypothetical protein Btru_051918 [Bulinus truncatus]